MSALLALVLRAVGACVRPPWHDEYFTAWVARLPWSDLLAALRLDSGPPLLYALSKLGAMAGVPPLGVARGIAVASGAGAVALVAATARLRWGAGAAWTAGLLLACHPLALHWGCEGRAYGLLLLATSWAWFELTRIERGSGTTWQLGLAVAVGCWSHSLGLVLAATAAGACVVLPAPARRRGLAAVALGLASHLPWLPVMLGQPPAAIAWMAHLWEQLPIPRSTVLALCRYLSPLAAFGDVLYLPSPPLGVEVIGGVALLTLVAFGMRRARGLLLPATGVVVPAIAFAVLVLASVPVFYPGRAHVLLLPPFVVVLAASGTRTTRAAAGLLAAGGLTLSLGSVAAWAAAPEPAEAMLARGVLAGLPEGGTVAVGGIWRLGLDYHLGRARERVELVSYPATAGHHPGWYVDGYDHPRQGELDVLLGRLARRPQAVGVVVATGAETAPDLRRLAARLGLTEAEEVPGGALYLPPAAHPGATR